ncbi:MAG: alpha-glucosidase, partial [Lachnospiraceae bacterium]|nr:alpha-glucosidase [Lachnospiraceae bacterium]
FLDTNGDGIGDLKGVISKLDYLQELGVEIVWLSPIYCSPLADQGYDISDYYNIDPRFGTMEEMDTLIAEAKKRGIGIVMDLVVNHCSDEHEWFKAACADPDGEYGQYFYIRDWKHGDPLPTNWRSYFGGPVWDLLPGHDDKVYLHVFHRKQPDLNWENPKVRQDIYKMINWWLDKGLAGFRIDAIINIKKDLPLRSYPADRADGLCSIHEMLDRAQGVGDFLNEMAENTFRPHKAFTVGEVFNAKPEDLPKIIGDNGYFSTMFDFAELMAGFSPKGWYDHRPVTAEEYKTLAFESQKSVEEFGFLSTLIENHDEPRGVSHYIPAEDLCLASKKMIGGINFMLRGLPFIYQGQEIGMENFHYENIEEADDISALGEYQVALDAGLTPEEALQAIDDYSRDNARSPFQWDSTPHAGFTSGTPWLRVNPNYPEINLASQIHDPDSVWNFYRSLIALRKNPAYKETIVYGKTVPYLQEQKNLFAYFRKQDEQEQAPLILVVGNFQRDAQTMVLPGNVKHVLINTLGELNTVTKGEELKLEGYHYLVMELE